MTQPDPHKALERSIDRLLREQPLRRAPASLAERVLTEIAHREARPWWQKGFHTWPTAARVLFCVACLGIVAFAVELPTWLIGAVDSNLPQSVSRGIALWQTLVAIGGSISHVAPMHWVYGALAAIALLYTAFFSAGIAAYRTLFAQPK